MSGVETVTFRNRRGDTLSGVLHHPAEARANGAVILCHGMESDKTSEKLVSLGEKLAQRGVLALRFDFAYAGESSGRFEDMTYSGGVEDIEAAYRFIQDRQRGKIAVFGSSMGGTVALLFAAVEPNVSALVTLAAPVHPEHFPRRLLNAAQLQDWRDRGFTSFHGRRLNLSLLEDLERLNVPESARNVRCPVLILHGTADEVVPVGEAYELHDCLPGLRRLSILPGADHRLSSSEHRQRALDEALGWLVDHVR